MKPRLWIVACSLLFIVPTHACPSTQPDLVGRRLTVPEIDALGAPVQSPCSNNRLPPDTKAGTCAVRGPYQGIITGKQGTEGSLSDALAACGADPSCLGVSSVWYTQSPWFAVTQASSFEVDTASYGCTMVLDCRETE
jgi:hypothetical protein